VTGIVVAMAVEFHHPARPFTFDDLEDMADDGYRREIIGGSLIVTPSPTGRHQNVVANLLPILVAAKRSDTKVLPSPYDWRLPSGDSVQPDLLVVRSSDFDPDGPLPPSAVPLLVVEILSKTNPLQDRIVKRALYERFAVPSYWIIDPTSPSLLALQLVAGSYVTDAELGPDDVLRTDRPFPVSFAIADLGN
jgi:Uma2 family endonuclease